jgi:protein-S-isoprenylcysteine O-methyltransferase Ste14
MTDKTDSQNGLQQQVFKLIFHDNYTPCPRHLQMTYVLVYGVGGCGVVWSTHTMRSGFDDKYLKYRQNEIEKLCIAETVKETRARQK